MKKMLKWTGIVLLTLVVFVAATAFYFSNNFEFRLKKPYQVQPADLAIPTDSASIAEGGRLAKIHCSNCHGNDFGGTVFFNDPSLASIPASNLTAGVGGIGTEYTAVDYVRAIRHGVKKSGKPALIMPAKEFQHLSDKNLGDIIAYLRSAPPVDRSFGEPAFTFMAKVLAGAGAFGDLINAEHIDHQAVKNVQAPPKSDQAEYGAYLVTIGGCHSCHGKDLNGFKDSNPNAPPGPNITPGGNFGKWTLDAFRQTLRTGTTPENKVLNPEFMPWKSLGQMDDTELTAVYNYLKQQPARATAKL